MNDSVIETYGLTKRYGRHTAVTDLSISVPAGVVAGFIGPNGAGKTTTMSMLMGLVSPSAGTASVLGKPLTDPPAYISQVGALIEKPAFYPGLSGAENLRILSIIGDTDPTQIPTLLELVGLKDRGGDRFGGYSTGMKQRLGIAAALLGEPALLILDEPTNGLDPAGIHEVRELIRGLADGGRTIFVSSHALAELEQVCDWFVIIDRGTVRYQGLASGFLTGLATGLSVATEDEADLERLRTALAHAGRQAQAVEGGLRVEVDGADPRALAAEVSRAAAALDVALVELHVERVTLEERYLGLINGGDR